MKIRVDLKIVIFVALFYITSQIKIYLAIMFFSFVHELGHIAMGIMLKMKLERLEIIPCGLSISFKTNIEDINLKIKQGNLFELKLLFVAMSGPIVSLILGILYTYIEPIFITRQEAVYSNILILLFNLLPIYPLDGARIIKEIIHIEFGNEVAQIFINKFSNITIIILTIIGSITVYYFKNIAIFLICIFLWIITLQENKRFKMNMKMYEISKMC